ncbi:MAG: hypothetical protein EXR12_03240 [Rhodospirillaceae bacterium]|nr:hypothetical protein [Rhodospirillaceae bacterium]
MPKPQRSALTKFRARQKRQGVVRVEVQVRREDAALVRRIAHTLLDPARGIEARALLKQQFNEPSIKGLKALLAAAPFDGIDLERIRDTGRKVDL